MSDWARRALEALDDRARLRRLRAVSPIGPCRVRLEGRTVRLFSSNDYLGLSTHREVRRALADAAREHGVGPRGAQADGSTNSPTRDTRSVTRGEH